MAYRLCLLLCFAASATVAVVLAARKPPSPAGKESDLRTRLFSNSWVDRANAAVQLADNPHAIPWLVATVDDEAPPVRKNVLWALHKLTGAPWASRTADCVKWWEATKGATAAATWIRANGAGDGPGRFEGLRVSLHREDNALVVRVLNEGGILIQIFPGSAEDYTAAVFDKAGRPVGVIDPAEPDAAAVETRVFDERGRTLETWWWSIRGLELNPGDGSSETYDLSALPPGRYLAESRVGPVTIEHSELMDPAGSVLGGCEGLRDTVTFTR